MGHRPWQGHPEAFVPEAPDEAFNETVLLRLAQRDVMSNDAALLLPLQEGNRRGHSGP